MIITKRSLPRRTFVRGLGAAVALPLLDAMIPALTAAVKTPANPVRRLGFVYVPNGVILENWAPIGEGRSFNWSPTLAPLEPVRDYVTIVTGLANKPADALGDGNGDHPRSTAAWLNATHPKKTEGADVRGGTTIDQIAANEFGQHTQLASLELALEPSDLVGLCTGYSCIYMDTVSWKTPTTPLPREHNPRVVFERLFGDDSSQAERLARIPEDRSLLDVLTRDLARLQKKVGPSDRARLTEYFDGIRDIERRIQKSQEATELDFRLPDRPIGVPDSFEEHCQLMFDLQVLAYQADITRVISFMIGREFSGRTYGQIGVPDPHHATSHHMGDAEKIQKVAKINTYHVQMFVQFLEKLKATPDGEGSLLDHMTILYGAGLGDGMIHSHAPLPVLVAGGAAGRHKGGRHIQCRKENDTPLANLLVSLLDMSGVRVETIGDSTGSLEYLTAM